MDMTKANRVASHPATLLIVGCFFLVVLVAIWSSYSAAVSDMHKEFDRNDKHFLDKDR